MPKKNRQQYSEISDKKGISNDSKSKNPLKLGNSEFLYKQNGGTKKSQGIFFDDDINFNDTNYYNSKRLRGIK